MKNIKLKIGFAIIFLFAMCFLKAQSVQQKFQKDLEQRKKHANEVLLKAREQQAQQEAENTHEFNMPQSTNATNSVQPNIQTVPVQQKKNNIKTQSSSVIKKPVTTQQAGPPRKENINQ